MPRGGRECRWLGGVHPSDDGVLLIVRPFLVFMNGTGGPLNGSEKKDVGGRRWSRKGEGPKGVHCSLGRLLGRL